MRRLTRRTLLLGALTAVGLLAVPGAAFADPAGPTHFRSTIDAVVADDGGDPGVEVEVLGGDAYLVVRASPGTRVEVPGYEGEPYLRIDPDGAVYVNTRSPALFLNQARLGEADGIEVPADADPAAPPVWERVARGGEYAWHDHRIHVMSPTLPASVDPSLDEVQEIWDWAVPLRVDGREVTVEGTLAWVPGPAPLLPIGATLLAIAAVVALVVARPSSLTPVVLGGAALTAVVGVAERLEQPPGADTEPALYVLPAMAIAAVAIAAALRSTDGPVDGWLRAASGVPVGVWGVVQLGALARPIVPGPFPVELVRVVVALALAVGVAALVTLGRRVLGTTPGWTAEPDEPTTTPSPTDPSP